MAVKVYINTEDNTYHIENSDGFFAGGSGKLPVTTLRCACENDKDLCDLPVYQMLNKVKWCSNEEAE